MSSSPSVEKTSTVDPSSCGYHSVPAIDQAHKSAPPPTSDSSAPIINIDFPPSYTVATSDPFSSHPINPPPSHGIQYPPYASIPPSSYPTSTYPPSPLPNGPQMISIAPAPAPNGMMPMIANPPVNYYASSSPYSHNNNKNLINTNPLSPSSTNPPPSAPLPVSDVYLDFSGLPQFFTSSLLFLGARENDGICSCPALRPICEATRPIVTTEEGKQGEGGGVGSGGEFTSSSSSSLLINLREGSELVESSQFSLQEGPGATWFLASISCLWLFMPLMFIMDHKYTRLRIRRDSANPHIIKADWLRSQGCSSVTEVAPCGGRVIKMEIVFKQIKITKEKKAECRFALCLFTDMVVLLLSSIKKELPVEGDEVKGSPMELITQHAPSEWRSIIHAYNMFVAQR